MPNKKIKKLPFWETVGRSFKYVLKNRKLLVSLLPVVAVLTVVQTVFNMPLMCSYNEKFCIQNWQSGVSGIILVVVAVGIIINYCRSIICKETVDYTSLKFFKRMFFYILWSFILTFAMGIPSAIFIMILSLAGVDTNTVLLLTTFLFFILGAALAPLLIGFPALAVDDNKLINLPKLFKLAKGNKMSIFFGQFVIMVPYLILSKMFVYLYNFLGINNYALNLSFVIITVCLGLMDAGFKGAFFAHIYQFLKYYDKDK